MFPQKRFQILLSFLIGICLSGMTEPSQCQTVSPMTLRSDGMAVSMIDFHRIVFNRLSIQQPTAWSLSEQFSDYETLYEEESSENRDHGENRPNTSVLPVVRGQMELCGGNNACWAIAIHGDIDVAHDRFSPGYNLSHTGLMVGYDWMRTCSSRIGMTGAYTTPRLRSGNGEVDADSYLFGLYYQENIDGLEINGWISYGHQEIETKRRDQISWNRPDLQTRIYRGSTEGDTLSTGCEIGKVTCYHGSLFLRPHAALEMLHGWQYGYDEEARGIAGSHRLGYNRIHQQQMFLRAGGTVKYETYTWLTAVLRAQYAYMFDGDSFATSKARYLDVPQLPEMKPAGASIERDFLLLGVGMQCTLGASGIRYVYGDYDVSMSKRCTAQTFTLGYIEKF